MFKILFPDMYVSSLHKINFDMLRDSGICALLLDLDNTIIPWSANRFPMEVVSWLEELKIKEFKLCIVSNNQGERLNMLADPLNIPFIPNAVKPRRKGFRKAIELLKIKKDQAAVIGDQIFTDILGGNRLGLYTILVTPMTHKEFAGTKINRFFERFVLKSIEKDLI